MDFFDRQEKARRSTKWLVVYFVLGVAMLILAVYAVSLIVFTGVSVQHSRHFLAEEPAPFAWWNPKLFLGVAAGTLAVIGLGSGFKIMELSQGGTAVASMMNGRLVNPSTTDPDERKLLNVVEEMALAS